MPESSWSCSFPHTKESADGAGVLEPSTKVIDGASSSIEHESAICGPINSMLESICEEDASNCCGSNINVHMNGEVQVMQDDDETVHRIWALLARFDPVRIRAEFQQLYLHRLHYQCREYHQNAESEVQAPEINPKSRALGDRLMEEQKGKLGSSSNHVDLMLWKHTKSEQKKEERRAMAKEEELTSCTFQPQFETKKTQNASAGAKLRTDTLYARAQELKVRKNAKIRETVEAREEAEVAGCTFKPDTGKSVRSYRTTRDGGMSVPRGFYECQNRLRAAGEAERQKWQQREDRMSRLGPITQSPGRRTVAVTSVQLPAEDSGLASHSITLDGKEPSTWASAEDHPDEQLDDFACRQSEPLPPVVEEYGDQGLEPLDADGSWNATDDYWSSAAIGETSDTLIPREGSKVTRMSNTLPGHGSSDTSRESHDPQFEDSWGDIDESVQAPLLYVDVNIGPGLPPERIVLREGQSINEVAADFAAKHVLTPTLAQRLHSLLKDVLQQQHLL